MIDQADKLRAMAESNPPAEAVRPANAPYTIAVTSGKGGVGKTSIAANIGVLLASRGVKTAILDADLGLSNVEVVLGCPTSRNLADLVLSRASVRDLCVDGPAGVKLISAGSGIAWLTDLKSEERRRLIWTVLASELDVDALVIDTAPGISDAVTDFLEVAHEIILVTTPEPTSVMDSYALIKTLALSRVETRIELLVNQSPDQQTAKATALHINSICGKFLPRSIDAWNWLPYDNNLRVAIASRGPVVQIFPESPVSRRLRVPAVEALGRIVSHRMAHSR